MPAKCGLISLEGWIFREISMRKVWRYTEHVTSLRRGGGAFVNARNESRTLLSWTRTFGTCQPRRHAPSPGWRAETVFRNVFRTPTPGTCSGTCSERARFGVPENSGLPPVSVETFAALQRFLVREGGNPRKASRFPSGLISSSPRLRRDSRCLPPQH